MAMIDNIVRRVTEITRYGLPYLCIVSLITSVFITMLPVYVCDTYSEKYCDIMTSNCIYDYMNRTHGILPDNNICMMNVKEECLKTDCDRAHCINTLVYKGLYTFWNVIFNGLCTIAAGIFIVLYSVYGVKFIDKLKERNKLARSTWLGRRRHGAAYSGGYCSGSSSDSSWSD